jgi:hypothetical protein
MQSNGNDSRVFRIDRFVVPAAGEAEFLQTVGVLCGDSEGAGSCGRQASRNESQSAGDV